MNTQQEAAEREAFEAVYEDVPCLTSTKETAWICWQKARATLSQQGGGAAAPGYKVVPVESLQEIVTDIRQHIAQGVGSEALVAAQRPGYGTGIYTYLKHKMDDISAMLAAAPPAPQEAREPLRIEQIKIVCGLSDKEWAQSKSFIIDTVRAIEAAHGIAATAKKGADHA